MLEPFHTTLNKRLTKTPKFYFNDVGLAARLQGWREPEPAFLSPQSGPLFENLVWTEILRTRDHSKSPWDLNFWRTKEGYEVDFLIHTAEKCLALEVKFSNQNIPNDLDFSSLKYVFGDNLKCAIVVAGGQRRHHPAKWPSAIEVVPISELAGFLKSTMD